MGDGGVHPIVFYDGVCGLCSKSVQFLLKRDQNGVFRFASLQSDFARDSLAAHGKQVDSLDTIYLLTNPGEEAERLYQKARAALKILTILGGAWSMVSVFSVLPTFLLDAFYDAFARRRYRIFGKLDQCFLPEQHHQARFLDRTAD